MAEQETDGEQAALWNGAGASGWVELQDVMDRVLEPLQAVLVDALGSALGSASTGRVLDVGCGTGATTVAMARRLGDGGECTGIDISEPMLAAARSRAERDGARATFVVADAQRHQFEPASVDVIASRFGVMFFDDFARAFANLRTAASPGGALRFVAWRRAEENPFMTTAETAAAPLLTIPPRDPDAPGQFALADKERVHAILEDSRWHDIEIDPIDVECTLYEKDLRLYLARLGPLGRALADVDAPTRDHIVETVRPAFDPYVHGDEVRFTAACWLVSAQA